MSRGMLVQVEQARTNPSVSTLTRIASALGVTVARLVEVADVPVVRIVEQADVVTFDQGGVRATPTRGRTNSASSWSWPSREKHLTNDVWRDVKPVEVT
ncbi:helix-turn-helix transcriptional regulator [Nonomuraea sp. NPDC048916]|uniref:helix-turn-helix domain-containing protein n=1 Tax=Nonomuraea sp. NPDC048916 TaxID=3154232 RepID=UPI0033C3925E